MAQLCRRRYSSRFVHLGLPNPGNNAVQQDLNREGKGGREEGSSGKKTVNQDKPFLAHFTFIDNIELRCFILVFITSSVGAWILNLTLDDLTHFDLNTGQLPCWKLNMGLSSATEPSLL